ncbi:PREDICTED: uncharacterized protein LOC104805390 [Tarenaya hassleriana]|uniref:uncharacterized protein LOC104805390 n=1 Tax=Tarenaya hassleriana TaxID=28532 RepID=UPI00053C6626|nr:PREDICTED: uncharacterized protein LOC104805390 [Tarenaya hassleriana]
MEVVVENPEEARPKDCVVEPRDPRGKTLGGEPKPTGSLESARENGARASENGDEKLRGNTDETEILSGKGVGVDNLNDPVNLEDSDMHGVSSLLKMKQHFGKKGNANSSDVVYSVKDVSVQHQEESEEEDDEEEEEDHGYQVGDFVWGKIKSHPWWPGQVYDSSDASVLALKIKRRGRLLVAYFGDGTFAWCRPSQLKPFEENFKELSRVSSLKLFVNAVEEAVGEMGRHAERLMTEQLGDDGVVRPVAMNAGIKDGVLVPDVRRETVSFLSFEPRDILGDVGNLAKTCAFSDLLELEVLKRKISAFYQSNGGYSLTAYHDAQPVPGLEDKDLVRAVKPRGPKGSGEEDGLIPDRSHHRSLEQCSGFPEHRLHHRRKQKSIAEILETEMAAQVKKADEPEPRSTGRKKRKRDDEVKDIEKTSTSASTTPRKRRNVSKLSIIENAGPKQEDEICKEKTLSRKRKKRSADLGDDASDKKDETAGVKEESDEKETLDLEEDGDSTPLDSLRKKVKTNALSVELESGNGETKVQTPIDSISRERKKSKYLSPPYTSEVGWKTRKSETGADFFNVSGQMANAAGNIMVANGGNPSEKPIEASALDSGHQELSGELVKAIDFLRTGAPAEEVRDQIRATALSPQFPKGDSSDHLMRAFISIYRSFTYHDGANSKIHMEQTSDKENEQNRKEQNETSKPSRKEDSKPEKKPKEKKQMEENKSETGKKDSGAELFVTFGPGSDLPKKDDLIKIYGKFGPLDEEKTDMFYNNFCARVAFVNLPDAEAAFDSSQEKCPFTTATTITFKLKLPSDAHGKSKERGKEKKPKNPRIEPEYVKGKLDEMRSMLDKTGGGMTEELKLKLEEELRNLLEKVSRIVV